MIKPLLCADDYALTEPVSAAIEQLAGHRRLSATSALVTTRHWTAVGDRVGKLARQVEVGLHFNLTLGSPLGEMRRLAPEGRLPSLGTLLRNSILGGIDPDEIATEASRQIARFRDVAGRDPDFIDGHQHVHALPGIREGFLAAVEREFPARQPWLRDPADRPARIFARRSSAAKALLLAALASGFGPRARALGFTTNLGFSGVSGFDRSVAFADELEAFLSHPGPRHLVMCHPGWVDAELSALDPVVDRRRDEFEALMTMPNLPDRIRHTFADGEPR